MDWDEIERNWAELKGEVKQHWSKLTDEDVEFVKGKYAELLGLLQERYGHAKEQAEQESFEREAIEAEMDHGSIDAARIRFVELLETGGDAVLKSACRLALEGIVSKRLEAAYRSGRTNSWTN